MNEIPTLAEIEVALDRGDFDDSLELAKRFLDHTMRNGPRSDDRAWIMLRVAVLWFNDQEPVPAMVWTQRALTEGPRADAFALMGEIARMEEDWPLAAKWFEVARTALCPRRCLRGVMDMLGERLDEHRTDLLHRRVEYGIPGDHLFIVMTCKGREQLFEQTMASLDCGRLVVVADTEGRGQAKTFFSALELAGLRDWGLVTIFEDDLKAVRNVITYIESVVFPEDVAMASWFHRFGPGTPMRDPYWLIDKAANFSHNQAITMPIDTVHKLLDSKECREWAEPHGADMLITQVMPDARVAYHFPNLVQHVGGDDSRVGNTGARTSPTFAGEDFDALTLHDLTR